MRVRACTACDRRALPAENTLPTTCVPSKQQQSGLLWDEPHGGDLT
jgi:hypothetical protein